MQSSRRTYSPPSPPHLNGQPGPVATPSQLSTIKKNRPKSAHLGNANSQAQARLKAAQQQAALLAGSSDVAHHVPKNFASRPGSAAATEAPYRLSKPLHLMAYEQRQKLLQQQYKNGIPVDSATDKIVIPVSLSMNTLVEDNLKMLAKQQQKKEQSQQQNIALKAQQQSQNNHNNQSRNRSPNYALGTSRSGFTTARSGAGWSTHRSNGLNTARQLQNLQRPQSGGNPNGVNYSNLQMLPHTYGLNVNTLDQASMTNNVLDSDIIQKDADGNIINNSYINDDQQNGQQQTQLNLQLQTLQHALTQAKDEIERQKLDKKAFRKELKILQKNLLWIKEEGQDNIGIEDIQDARKDGPNDPSIKLDKVPISELSRVLIDKATLLKRRRKRDKNVPLTIDEPGYLLKQKQIAEDKCEKLQTSVNAKSWEVSVLRENLAQYALMSAGTCLYCPRRKRQLKQMGWALEDMKEEVDYLRGVIKGWKKRSNNFKKQAASLKISMRRWRGAAFWALRYSGDLHWIYREWVENTPRSDKRAYILEFMKEGLPIQPQWLDSLMNRIEVDRYSKVQQQQNRVSMIMDQNDQLQTSDIAQTAGNATGSNTNQAALENGSTSEKAKRQSQVTVQQQNSETENQIQNDPESAPTQPPVEQQPPLKPINLTDIPDEDLELEMSTDEEELYNDPEKLSEFLEARATDPKYYNQKKRRPVGGVRKMLLAKLCEQEDFDVNDPKNRRTIPVQQQQQQSEGEEDLNGNENDPNQQIENQNQQPTQTTRRKGFAIAATNIPSAKLKPDMPQNADELHSAQTMSQDGEIELEVDLKTVDEVVDGKTSKKKARKILNEAAANEKELKGAVKATTSTRSRTSSPGGGKSGGGKKKKKTKLSEADKAALELKKKQEEEKRLKHLTLSILASPRSKEMLLEDDLPQISAPSWIQDKKQLEDLNKRKIPLYPPCTGVLREKNAYIPMGTPRATYLGGIGGGGEVVGALPKTDGGGSTKVNDHKVGQEFPSPRGPDQQQSGNSGQNDQPVNTNNADASGAGDGGGNTTNVTQNQIQNQKVNSNEGDDPAEPAVPNNTPSPNKSEKQSGHKSRRRRSDSEQKNDDDIDGNNQENDPKLNQPGQIKRVFEEDKQQQLMQTPTNNNKNTSNGSPGASDPNETPSPPFPEPHQPPNIITSSNNGNTVVPKLAVAVPTTNVQKDSASGHGVGGDNEDLLEVMKEAIAAASPAGPGAGGGDGLDENFSPGNFSTKSGKSGGRSGRKLGGGKSKKQTLPTLGGNQAPLVRKKKKYDLVSSDATDSDARLLRSQVSDVDDDLRILMMGPQLTYLKRHETACQSSMDEFRKMADQRCIRVENRKNEIIKLRDQKIRQLEYELQELQIAFVEIEKINRKLGAGLVPDLERKIEDLTSDRDFLLTAIKSWFDGKLLENVQRGRDEQEKRDSEKKLGELQKMEDDFNKNQATKSSLSESGNSQNGNPMDEAEREANLEALMDPATRLERRNDKLEKENKVLRMCLWRFGPYPREEREVVSKLELKDKIREKEEKFWGVTHWDGKMFAEDENDFESLSRNQDRPTSKSDKRGLGGSSDIRGKKNMKQFQKIIGNNLENRPNRGKDTAMMYLWEDVHQKKERMKKEKERKKKYQQEIQKFGNRINNINESDSDSDNSSESGSKDSDSHLDDITIGDGV